MSSTATATSNDPIAKAISEAKEPITQYWINLPESNQGFPIDPEDGQTSASVIDAVSALNPELAQSDITCTQTGGRLTITLRSKPADKG